MNYEDKLIQMKHIIIGFLTNKGLSFMDAEDLYQELFIKVKITLETGVVFENEKRFYAWIFVIATNMYTDIFRKKSRSKEVEMNEWKNDKSSINILGYKPDLEKNIEDEIIYTDTVNECMDAVSKLPESQKRIIELRLFKGMTYKDIVEKTGLGVNTLLGQFRYAKMNLRKRIL